MGKRDLFALLSLSSWCLMIVVWLFLAMPWVFLQFVIVVFPDHTHLLFLKTNICPLFEWPLKTGFTVVVCVSSLEHLYDSIDCCTLLHAINIFNPLNTSDS